ncbi:MAG: choice-of-anchor D domain-containing protein, partial [Acidimicrobiales bacterium]
MIGAAVALGLGVGAVGLVAGAGAAGAMNTPALAFTPSSHSFGSVTLQQTASQSFILSNTGRLGSSALKLALSGSGASAYTITNDTCSATSLGPNKSCTVTVVFAPTAAGSATAT